MNISIFGLGYVGCVSLGCLAQDNNEIIGVDIDPKKVQLINQGKATVSEKGLDNIISEQRKKGNISATLDYKTAVLESDVSFICVGTPSDEDGFLNLDYIFNTVSNIAEALVHKDNFHILVIRSTVPPGTCDAILDLLNKKIGTLSLNFGVVSNPEFLREGTAVEDYRNPNLTVLGSRSDKAIELMKEIYKPFESTICTVDVKIAEMIKFVNNSFHALKVSFANEIGNICKSEGIDSHELMNLFIKDKKLNLSSYYLKPGFSYGGSCLPKDLKALNMISKKANLQNPILESIEDSNHNQKLRALELIRGTSKKRIGILGLSFKKDTDDLRNSPILDVINSLISESFEVKIHDSDVDFNNIFGTNASYLASKSISSECIVDDFSRIIRESEVLVITKATQEYEQLVDLLDEKIVIDLVRLFENINDENYIGICW